MQGYIISVTKSPRDTSLVSRSKNIQVPAGTTRRINLPMELQGLARSVAVINQDGANPATIILNNDRAAPINLPASTAFPFNDQWIEQVEITAGAAGRCDVLLEVVPLSQLGVKSL